MNLQTENRGLASASRWALALALSSLLFPLGLSAQVAQIGTIEGKVLDPNGDVLPGVSIKLTSQERGTTWNATTNANGTFRVPGLPLGRYRVEASAEGYQSVALRDNVVETQKTTSVKIDMELSAQVEAITVTGEAPVIDKYSSTQTSRLSNTEFEKLPIGRSYQTLFGIAPGVVGTGNANVNGALGSNNLFMFDGVDVTDPTTGTFASNLNFEAIEEVNIYTSGISAEYGRAVGGVLNVVTKSGGNKFEGSVKYIASNDNWNDQNRTHNEVTGASLARDRNDILNDRVALTLGGPFWRDHLWFFGAYESFKSTSPARTTVVTNENYTQTTDSPFFSGRLTAQLGPSHNAFVRYHESPTTGFARNYFGGPAEIFSLTGQDQTASSTTVQWNGVFTANLVAEALVASADETITVFPFADSALDGGAPHYNLSDGFVYNGGAFDGFVSRPRDQAVGAVNYFTSIGRNDHNLKFGVDYQKSDSGAQFAYPNNQLYLDTYFDPATRDFGPFLLRDYGPPVASTSNGKILALYARDKFGVGDRLFFEVGLRYEQEQGESDIGESTVDNKVISPRLSLNYDLHGDGRSLIKASAGRLYQFIIQNLSDQFAQVPQQANYDLFVWNGAEYVFNSRVETAGNDFMPNLDLKPTYVDELTLGYEQQLGKAIGVGVRGIWREWGDLVDDIVTFGPSGEILRTVQNYDFAKRSYKGLQLTFDKRYSDHWNLFANYTYSQTDGNHYSNLFSELGDFVGSQCRGTVDSTVGTVPCAGVANSALKDGGPSYDRPHDLKFGGAYLFQLGPVNLTLGSVGEWISGSTYEKTGTASVLDPFGDESGQTLTYFYTQNGSDHLGDTWSVDASVEATWRIFNSAEIGLKAEVFNVTDNQEKIGVNNTTWCNDATAACQTNRDRYGTATSRGSFQGPRSYRFTALVRF